MPSFPEEPLDSTLGYFAASPQQTLDDGRWTLLRKLGWGHQSSTWLAESLKDDSPNQFVALKIFTVAASENPITETKLKFLEDTTSKLIFDVISTSSVLGHFYENGPRGKHLCMIQGMLGASIESFRLEGPENLGGSLPVHFVKKIISEVLSTLIKLEKKKIIHGAVTTENAMLCNGNTIKEITKILAKDESPEPVQEIKGDDDVVYPAVLSRPMPHPFRWNSPPDDVAHASVYLNNFRHAHLAGGVVSLDGPPTILPPEAFWKDSRKISAQVNIWQLGLMTYLLLTGTPLFSDSYAEAPMEAAQETWSKLDELLTASKKVSARDVPSAASFLRLCLAPLPKDRPTASNLNTDKWVREGAVCACGWHPDDGMGAIL